ncbi:MAG TPA: hypothetical protein VLB80_04885 [Candidatus Babeliales bacterium]|nr:hypothetical protein [Candidatus Babeliales bacterium]
MNISVRCYLYLSLSSFLFAFLFFAIYNGWIFFCFAWPTRTVSMTSAVIQKKRVIHYFFHSNKWKTEKQEILWTESVEKNIIQLINGWLALLNEENIIAKKITLQSVLLSSAGDVYLSFNHNILCKKDTIFKKWMLIEGLLKTMINNDINVQRIQFLVQHKFLYDVHLDFSSPWPIHGFIQ